MARAAPSGAAEAESTESRRSVARFVPVSVDRRAGQFDRDEKSRLRIVPSERHPLGAGASVPQVRRLHVIVPLVLVAGCTALAVPNLYTAMQRAKQKRSMGTLRDLGMAVDAYAAAHGSLPRAGYFGPVIAIVPALGKNAPPAVDGWNHPILYHASAKHYVLRSTGRDGRNDGMLEGDTTNFDDDIVFADGVFMRHTEGL
jgi:type II secretory pathway pseudopilin PulG